MKTWRTIMFGGMLMACLALGGLKAQNSTTLSVMPLPASARLGDGWLSIGPTFHFSVKGQCDSRVTHAIPRLVRNLSALTGIPVRNSTDADIPGFIISCRNAGAKVQTVDEDESYRLAVTPSDVHLDAPNPLGVLHGMQTLLQLVRIGPNGFAVPAVTIEDRPRFPWRGLLIDVSRHFMPLDVVKRNLDGMEALKLNVLHWHLSDDQGFRVESRRFPRLQELSSEGMYYTQAEMRELIEYARDRGIRVVPEFDMPGHSTSWFVGYPELASAPGPYAIEHKWGIFDPAMDPTRESTYRFLNDFIAEMAQLFPEPYFHIGGDEVNGKQWDGNLKLREFMQKHRIKDNHALQAYFNQRLQAIVSKHGKIMIGWDEILQPDLPREAVVQSWRGQASLAEAVRVGHRALLSHGYYLDLMQPASLHYSVDPLGGDAASLSAEEKQRVLGGEACMWAEFVTPANVEARIWPRAAAIAERLWSPADVNDAKAMYSRMEVVSRHLEFLGLVHKRSSRLMLERLRGSQDIRSLQVLAQVLEPVKEYGREEAREYHSRTPLNRLVDSVPPESDVAREFSGMVDGWIGHPSPSSDFDAMKSWLIIWQHNDQELEPVLHSNSLLQELIPLSENLQNVATAGLQALDYLGRGGRAPSTWREQQLAMLKLAEKPQAELIDMIAPAVERLVAATTPE